MRRFDLALYFPIPMLSTESMVSLGTTLIDVAPEDPPAYVAAGIAVFTTVLGEVKSGLVSKIDEDLSTATERNFDIVVDRAWLELRERLAFFEIYTQAGMNQLTEADREQLDWETRLEQARTAAVILLRLFGDGTEFLRAPYPQQATHMAARLEWLDDKQLNEALADLVGTELTNLIAVCQVRYQAMVSQRGSRAGKSLADLRELRDRLRRQIYSYAGLIGTMVQLDDPASEAVAEAALRPILVARANAKRKSFSGFGVEDGAELDANGLDVEAEAESESEDTGEDVIAGESEPSEPPLP